MHKLISYFILVTVCSTALAKNDANLFTQTSLPYIGIEVKIPTVFLEGEYGYFKTKDDKYTASFVFINKGREAMIKKLNKKQSFVKNLFSNDSSIKEDHTPLSYSYIRVFKYGTDGLVATFFRIDKELSKSKIDKYIELSKDALNSISYSEKNIDFMAKLPFKVSSIKEGEVSLRTGVTIVFQKREDEKIGVGISYKKKGSKPWADFPLDFSYMKEECDKKIVSNEPDRIIAGVKAQVKKISQSCQRGKYNISKKSTPIRYDTSFVLGEYEVVASYLNKEGKEQGGWAFYQDVLDNIKSEHGSTKKLPMNLRRP